MHYKEQSRELHPKPKFLVVTEAYLSATFGQKIQIYFDLCLLWVSVVSVPILHPCWCCKVFFFTSCDNALYATY